MNDHVRKKSEILKEIFAAFKSALIAFSGGVDSGLWSKSSADTTRGRVLAVTTQSVLSPPGEVEAARTLTGEIGVDHQILAFNPLSYEEIRSNHKDRCYHCKKTLAGHTRGDFDREPEAAL